MDEPKYEESDFVDVRSRSFPAGADFLNQHDFSSQFGAEDDEDEWTDDDGDDGAEEPECRTQ